MTLFYKTRGKSINCNPVKSAHIGFRKRVLLPGSIPDGRVILQRRAGAYKSDDSAQHKISPLPVYLGRRFTGPLPCYFFYLLEIILFLSVVVVDSEQQVRKILTVFGVFSE